MGREAGHRDGRRHGGPGVPRRAQHVVRLLPCQGLVSRSRRRWSGDPMTPEELAARLGQPNPTPEQSAAIGAPLEPGVIVAGAGSGKTETMAARVVWLVVNGLVRPEQVLGLTFTRKAARELGARIRRRLGQLAARGVLETVLEADPSLLDGEPTVVTYDALAGRIVGEHALRLGREPASRLVTESVTWQ